MAVAFFSVAASTQTATATCQVNLTCTSQAVLLAFVFGQDPEGASCSAVAYNGVAMTRLAAVSASGGAAAHHTSVWGLTAPNAGVLTLSATISANFGFWQAVGITYTGAARGGNPFGTPRTGTALAATNVNLSISATTTSIVVGALNCTDAIVTNWTQRHSAAPNYGTWVGETAGAATKSLSASTAGVTAFPWALLAIPVVVSVAATASVPSMSLLGAGF